MQVWHYLLDDLKTVNNLSFKKYIVVAVNQYNDVTEKTIICVILNINIYYFTMYQLV